MLKRPRPLLTCRARVLRSVLTVIALAVTSSGLTAVVFGVGDIAYPQGTAANFRDCFNPEWGRFRGRWHPVPGNHEYESADAGPYFLDTCRQEK